MYVLGWEAMVTLERRVTLYRRLPYSSDDKESACNARDPGSTPGSGRSPGEGHGNPLQYSCIENSMDRGPWQATYGPWGLKKLDTTELHIHTF